MFENPSLWSTSVLILKKDNKKKVNIKFKIFYQDRISNLKIQIYFRNITINSEICLFDRWNNFMEFS